MALDKMFSGVVSSYDLLNSLITFGLDRRWRRKAAKYCGHNEEQLIIDLGTGTGDLAFHIEDISPEGTQVAALDFSENMIKTAREKKAKHRSSVNLIVGGCLNLPFNNNSFDCITTSFSFRNMTYKNPDTDKILKEIFRILKPGGKFIIVESSQPGSPVFRKLFKIYAGMYVPFIGRIVSGDKKAYRYLGTSMANYYNSREVIELLKKFGFSKISYEPLALGVAGIHVAEK